LLFAVLESFATASIDRRIRIDVLHGLKPPNVFRIAAYIEESITAQPTYPQTEERFDREPESMRVWTSYHLPWVERDSADGALAQALGFLSERVST
jgi:hypothetical protein